MVELLCVVEHLCVQGPGFCPQHHTCSLTVIPSWMVTVTFDINWLQAQYLLEPAVGEVGSLSLINDSIKWCSFPPWTFLLAFITVWNPSNTYLFSSSVPPSPPRSSPGAGTWMTAFGQVISPLSRGMLAWRDGSVNTNWMHEGEMSVYVRHVIKAQHLSFCFLFWRRWDGP